MNTSHRDYLSSKDFHECLKYLHIAKSFQNEQQDWWQKEGVLIAALVAYGRPFKASNSSGITARSIKLPENLLSDTEKTLHDLLIELRDGAFAHSDWGYRNTEVTERRNNGISRRSNNIDIQTRVDINTWECIAGKLEAHFDTNSFVSDLSTNS
jgi:hypothetical protein